MKKVFEQKIKDLSKRIFEQALHKFDSAKVSNRSYKGLRTEIEIAPHDYIAFAKWGNDWRKPFFLILWRGSRYLMEFDLSRVIFTGNGRLTWILNIPARKQNKKHLHDLEYKIKKIDPNTVDEMHKQMTMCNGRAKRTPKGYVLAEEELVDEAIARFLEIISYSIKSDQEIDLEKGRSPGDEDLKALEGQITESKVLGRRRNQAVVAQRKNVDRFTCQACLFCAEINGRHVIECHHKFPLRQETITEINDLVCLCPTCHRIAHRRDKPYSVKEIQCILKRMKS